MCPLIHWHIECFLSKHFKSSCTEVKPLNFSTHASYPHSTHFDVSLRSAPIPWISHPPQLFKSPASTDPQDSKNSDNNSKDERLTHLL
ncbi:hypothetical protein J4Q44_G00334260 [Coregonus suidteri]|uniref:Uncharacterized protein n=1 Tax=Coregonus suidteri TaxID=861788 RepID=A0AAN8QGJ3_9TELE